MKLLTDLRRAGVALAAKGERLAFDAPAGLMTPAAMSMLKGYKPELLAVLRGEYLRAAVMLVNRVGDPEFQSALIEQFDERAGICEYGGNMSYSEANRQAYIELSEAMERLNPEETTQDLRQKIAEPCSPDLPLERAAPGSWQSSDLGNQFWNNMA